MGKKTNRFLSAVLALVMTSSLALTVSAETASAGAADNTAVVEYAGQSAKNGEGIDSGTWGSLTWVCNENTGVLTITGNGRMIRASEVYIGTTEYYPWEYHSFNTVIIGNGVTTVAENAFYNMGITSVSLPNTLTTIERDAFALNHFENLTIPDSVTAIGKEAFYNCWEMKTLTLSNSLTTIAEGAFCTCSSLEEVTIPASVTSIGAVAFMDCHALKKITVLNPNAEIGNGAIDTAEWTGVCATIYCYANSTAYTYAVENNIPYVIIGGQEQIEITKLTPNKTTAYVGNTVVFTPTVKNDSNINLSDCTYKYTITKAGIPSTYNGNSAGKLSWKPNESGKYSVKCEIVYNNRTVAEKTINYTVKAKALSVTVKVTPDGEIGVPDNATIKAAATGGTGPYKYRYEMNRFGTTTVIKDWSTSASVKKLMEQDGYYTFTVSVKDAAGTVVSAQASKTVNRCLVNFDFDKTNAHAGEKVNITPSLGTASSLITSANYQFTITKGSASAQYSITSGDSLEWTPAAAGTYTVKCDVVYNNKTYDSFSKTYNVLEAEADEVTIYYKGYTKPYIHYRTAGGTWTTAPGVAMSSSFAVSGYPYKYTIKLNGAANAEVCFNDGNGNWDSNNGSNYIFTKGTYTFNGGVITAIADPGLKAKLSVSKTTVSVNTAVKLTAAGENGTTPYTYYFSYTLNGKTTKIRDYATSKTCNFTPTEAGTYTFKTVVKDASGKTASATKKVTVQDIQQNTVTIYYKGYANPNIHYQVGDGAWTSVPGVAMTASTEVSGYTHKYTIDLGSASYANVCFNDGNGHWDSNNGSNYRFTQGTYKFSNGTITAM